MGLSNLESLRITWPAVVMRRELKGVGGRRVIVINMFGPA
jgi:hypothetical protein